MLDSEQDSVVDCVVDSVVDCVVDSVEQSRSSTWCAYPAVVEDAQQDKIACCIPT